MRMGKRRGPSPEMRKQVDERLRTLISHPEDVPQRLQEAMRYTLLAPAKRIRASLVLIVAQRWHVRDWRALDIACAVEMVHAASLIFDDLPCMDNAEMRRGNLSCHRKFGEATAILAAIGLLSRAYSVIMEDRCLDATQKVRICKRLSAAVGPGGLTSGQVLDLDGSADRTTPLSIQRINAGKTGSLFAVAAEIGAIAGGACDAGVETMRDYGQALGLAFQALDDVIDAAGTAVEAGKDVRKDIHPTVVDLLGVDGAAREAKYHIDDAIDTAKSCGESAVLESFAKQLNECFAKQLSEVMKVRQCVAVAG